jgi:DNA-binding winged helix-turn-helix (wHTH) protein
MPSSVPCRRVCFGPFEADLRSGELRRDGVKVRLQEQPFHVLAVLLERPGDVVTREELHSRLWPADTVVDFDHGLNTAICSRREVLEDARASKLTRYRSPTCRIVPLKTLSASSSCPA